MADEIADTFGRLALMHEETARTTGSVRAADARKRAVEERSVERHEREAAKWFRSIESATSLD